MPHPTEHSVRESFTAFFTEWLVRQQAFLEQMQTHLSILPPDGTDKDSEPHRHLVEQVMCHYQQYYTEKTKAATEDVFLLFSPPWFSSFERTFLWVSGFKPSFVFQLVNRAVGSNLTAEQMKRIETVRAETKRGEREIGDAMARVQESVAAPPLFDFVRRVGQLVDGEVSEFDTAMDELKDMMRVVMGEADALRGATVKKVVDILTPVQTVKLFAGAAEFQLQTRRLGLQRDSRRATASTDDDV